MNTLSVKSTNKLNLVLPRISLSHNIFVHSIKKIEECQFYSFEDFQSMHKKRKG